MARIPYFDPTKAQGRAKKQYERLPDLNIFRMLGHSGEMLDGFSKLGGHPEAPHRPRSGTSPSCGREAPRSSSSLRTWSRARMACSWPISL